MLQNYKIILIYARKKPKNPKTVNLFRKVSTNFREILILLIYFNIQNQSKGLGNKVTK